MLDFLAYQTEPSGMLFRIAVVLAFTASVSYYDIFNKKWVPNWLVYSFAAAALLLNIVFFQSPIFPQSLLFGIGTFAICYPLYKAGQLGGADAYVLASIALAIPYFNAPLAALAQSVPYPFIFSVLVPTGIVFMLHMLARFIPYISRRLSQGKVKFNAQKLVGPLAIALSLAVFIYVLSSLPFELPPSYFAVLAFLSVALFFFTAFKQEIKDSMVEMVRVSRLQEEDVLALEKMSPSLVKRLAISPLIDKQVISALKKAKIRSVPVYTGMPFFLPYLFIGVLFTVLFGDLLYYIAHFA